jgi:light-regulated signal transduction histidine kinase (bacteriophytochrome)
MPSDPSIELADPRVELVRTRHELEERNAALEASNADLEQFAYVASHDLSEPLRAVSGFAQLLGRRYRGELDEDADRYIGHIVGGVERMQGLIDDLLTYARVGADDVTPIPVDSGELVTSVVASIDGLLDSGARVRVVEPLPLVSGDPALLRQLFQNLIANAIKFRSQAEPEIVVSASCEGALHRFSIADNGIGIDDRHAQRIFEVFKRLHARERFPGTGIGLAICKRVVERHGGRIWLDPDPASGSVFHFTLPTAAPGA